MHKCTYPKIKVQWLIQAACLPYADCRRVVGYVFRNQIIDTGKATNFNKGIMKNKIRYVIMCLLGISILMGCSNKISQKEISNPNYSFGTIHWNGKWIKKDTTNLKYPCTLDSIILVFFHTWDDSTTYEFKNFPDSILANLNHETGMWLRNSYGLWSRTCLVEYFWELGIFHPDDISAIVLTCYHRFLNGKELKVDEQVEMFKSFWKNEMDIEYKLEDSLSWEFPPSLWDFGITKYETNKKK